MREMIMAYSKAAIIREEQISKLLLLAPKDREYITNNIERIEQRTFGLQWCIDYLLTGKSFCSIKKGWL